MRRRTLTLVAGLLLGSLDAQAQTSGGPTSSQAPAGTLSELGTSNMFDVGVRGTAFSSGSDRGRSQFYRDLRNGPTLDFFQFAKDTNARALTVRAEHVGYRDQRYWATYDNFGKLRVSFLWDQTPLFYSERTSTLFNEVAPGVLRLDDSIQTGLQNKTTTLTAATTQAQAFDLRQRRDTLDLRLRYSATDKLDLNVAVKNTMKTGSQPWAGTFGFSDAIELDVPLDTRTTELGTSLEWSSPRGVVRLGYDGSFFRNNVSTLVWDNPLRVTDSPTAGALQGRMALWPDSNLNSANAMGALNLPGHSRASAYVSVGNWTQDAALIPYTINTALPTIPLDRATADAKALVTAMTYAFTSKPTDLVWLSARYRSYDYDNRTPVFNVTKTVAYDTSSASFAEGGTSPFSFKRRTFDADASLTPVAFTALRVGYTRETINQTFRSFDTTTEDTVRVSADTTRLSWLTVRGLYEHAKRVGSGFDEQSLDDLGEQISLRQFDISDRLANRFSGIVQLMPAPSVAFNGTVSIGNEDRQGAVFGLRSNNSHGYSVGVDLVPANSVSFGMSYEFEKYNALQASRQANPGPQFNDPTRDWTTDTADKAHTFTTDVDLIKLLPRTDLRFAYNYSRAQSTYVYGLAPNSSLPPVVQLPPVINDLQRGTLDLRYYVTSRLAAGFLYWYDKYAVDDFAQGQATLNSLAQPSFLTLGYVLRPYTAHTITARLTYLW